MERISGEITLMPTSFSTDQQKKIWDHFQNHESDQFSGNQPRVSFLLKKTRSLVLSKNKPQLLNIGAGNGFLEKQLLQEGHDIYSLDLSDETVLRLKSEGIKSYTGTITQSPFKDSQFDAIIASEVLEHLSKNDLPIALNEIKRTLKNNGYFIGTVPYEEKLTDNTVFCPHCKIEFHRWGHQQSFSLDSLKKILSEKFTVNEIYSRSFIDWNSASKKQLAKSFIRYILSRFGFAISQPNIFFVCTNKQ